MTDLEQIADEAIRLRTDHVTGGPAAASVEAELRRRSIRLMQWRAANPALDALAVDREASIGRLYAAAVIPDAGCNVQAGRVQLECEQDYSPLQHRYLVLRRFEGRTEVIGTAWLTNQGPAGRYVVSLYDHPDRMRGGTLREALQRTAVAIDTYERVNRAAAKGATQ